MDGAQAGAPRAARSPLVGKIIVVGGLILALLVPIGWILGIVGERQQRFREVQSEIADTWGGRQVVQGPLLLVPYVEHYRIDGEERTRTCRATFLPETLRIETTVVPERRSRGIFDVVLYAATLRVSGSFTAPDFTEWKIEPEDVRWEDATLSFGVPDLRGLAEQPVLDWEEVPMPFRPGAGRTSLYSSGMQALVGTLAAGATHRFAFTVTLHGTEDLSFIPVGKETEVVVDSSWPDPSFGGAFLPLEREVGEAGFRARWKVSWFARAYPQSWNSGESEGEIQKQQLASGFGVRLLDPVDFYRMTERSVKYAALFVVLTFLTFFLYEVLGRLRVHPVQYLLVGLALCIFYLILLSFSEQLGFAPAYLLATVATVALIGGYAAAVLGAAARGAIMAAALSALYGYLYVLLQLQDWALLLGTVALFLILAFVMLLTRRVDWYAIELERPVPAAS